MRMCEEDFRTFRQSIPAIDLSSESNGRNEIVKPHLRKPLLFPPPLTGLTPTPLLISDSTSSASTPNISGSLCKKMDMTFAEPTSDDRSVARAMWVVEIVLRFEGFSLPFGSGGGWRAFRTGCGLRRGWGRGGGDGAGRRTGLDLDVDTNVSALAIESSAIGWSFFRVL